jgi:hypothetical protein
LDGRGRDCRCQQGVGCVVGSLRRSAGFRAFGLGFLRRLVYLVFCGVSAFGSGGCTISHLLVLLDIMYPALVCARCMLALTSATPGMPYAAVRALGISTPGRSLSRVIPAVRTVRGVRIEVALHTRVCSQVASRARVPASPTGCTRPKRGVRDLRRPPLERDFFFLMGSKRGSKMGAAAA